MSEILFLFSLSQVSDIAIAVREGTDAVMLSGESAYGQFPYKAVDVMCTVAKHTEASMLSYAVSSHDAAVGICCQMLFVCIGRMSHHRRLTVCVNVVVLATKCPVGLLTSTPFAGCSSVWQRRGGAD